jgi:uncharacterized protein (TIGR00251 family)
MPLAGRVRGWQLRVMIELVAQDDGVLVPVKVVPGASKSRIVGELGGRLKVAVAAPPEKGKANAALEALLADRLGARRRDVSVVAGHNSPIKTVRVAGLDIEAVKAALT